MNPTTAALPAACQFIILRDPMRGIVAIVAVTAIILAVMLMRKH